jgi:predicted DNA-binding helix-hairpin-helix protein
MIKRDKWHFLSTQVGYDKYTVPIFEASAKNKCVPLLKTLMSSNCHNNCKFCSFRYERRTIRERWEPSELAKVTMHLWKKGKIKGIFLSSSVEKDPDFVVQKEIETIKILRNSGFTAYSHLRLMPSVSRELIKQSVEIADRVGINLEFPKREYYNDMKIFLDFKQDIIKRLRWVAEEVNKAQKEGKCKSGLDSQTIVGASNETDKEIIEISNWLYHKLQARRVYYSRFEPIKNTPLENKEPETPWREYRLYQSSFLLRDYGFEAKDFVFDDNDRLNLSQDPKYQIAKEKELIVDINEAEFDELIKIPGIGLKIAQKIIENRPIKDSSKLKSLGVILKRASPFIDINKIHQTTLSKWIN